MTIHFQRIPRGTAYPQLADRAAHDAAVELGMVKARYYLGNQKYVAVFTPSPAGPDADLRPVAAQAGVVVEYVYLHPLPATQWTRSLSEVVPGAGDQWQRVPPASVTRYAFVVRWPDGREPELATRNGRLVVSTDKTVLCPPYDPVVFSGDPAWTVPVADEPMLQPSSADESSASDQAMQDNPKESP